MKKDDEVLSREVAIAAEFAKNGVTLKAKSRTVSALDRLFGSVLDVPSAYFEGVAAKRRQRDLIHAKLADAQATLARSMIKEMPELGGALIADVLEERARKQINTSGVAIETIHAMRNPAYPNSQAELNHDPQLDSKIDEDWMNQFVRFAEDASSDQLQQLWGRVLAGEINKPHTYSRQTLRFLSELDKKTAENCEYFNKHVIEGWALQSDKWNEGNNYIIRLDLTRLGLIAGENIGGPTRKFVIDGNGILVIADKTSCFVIKGKPATEVAFQVYLLTRLGQEVMSLLDPGQSTENLRDLSDHLNKSDIKTIFLGKVVHNNEYEVIFDLNGAEKLWGNERNPYA